MRPMNLIRHMKIGNKILFLNVLAVLFLSVLTITNYFFLRDMNRMADQLYQDDYLPTTWIAKLESNVHTMNDRLLEHTLSTDPHYRDVLDNEIGKIRASSNQLLIQYEASVQGDPVNELWVSKLKKSLLSYENDQNKVKSLAVAGQEKEAYAYYKTHIKSTMEDISSYMESLQKDRLETSSLLNAERTQLYVRLIWILILSSMLAVGVFYFFGRWISTLIVRPLQTMQILMAEAESGQLALREVVVANDEVGMLHRSFQSMTGSLRNFIGHVQQNTLQLAQQAEQFSQHAEQSKLAAESIAVSTDTLSQGIQGQVESVTEALHTMQEMKQELGSIHANSHQMALLADTASQSSQSGMSSVEEMKERIELICAKVSSAGQVVDELRTSCNQINAITGVIAEIAEQTNLLALNAAIEAARAGDAGKGFNVVADEVRKLASQTNQAAKQIIVLLREIGEKAGDVDFTMKQGVKLTKDGVQASNEVGHALLSIQVAFSSVSLKVDEVSSSIAHVSERSDSVVNAMLDITAAANEGASSSQETASANEEQLAMMEEISLSSRTLHGMAAQLQQALIGFKV